MAIKEENSTEYERRKYRLCPTDEQAALMREYCGATRLVYNTGLEQRQTSYEMFGRSPGYARQCASLKEWRSDIGYEWLRHTPSQVLQQSLADLNVAFERFFAGISGYPRFKRKFKNDSFRVPQHVKVRRLSRKWGEVRLQGLGWVRFRFHRAAGGAVSNATVTFKAGQWHVSFCVKRAKSEPKVHTGPAVGADRGVANTIMLSDGRAAT